MKRIRIFAFVVLALLAGCTASPNPEETPLDLAEELAALPGIVAVDRDGDPHLTATVALTADDATVRDAARTAHELATQAEWEGEVVFLREGGALDPDTDLSTPVPWTQQVFPGDVDEIAVTLATLLELEKMPGVVSVALDDDWPTVVLGSLETFAASFRALSELPVFANGGTYALWGEQRLYVVHIPERMTVEAIEAVIRVAVEHPHAEVEVQALPDPGGRWPQVYIARLTPDEVIAVDAQLRDPGLADADPEGYPVTFFLSAAPDADGIDAIEGTFGDVPR